MKKKEQKAVEIAVYAALDKGILAIAENRKRPKIPATVVANGAVHVTDAVKCLRQAFLGFHLDNGLDGDADKQTIFDDGFQTEEQILKFLAEAGITVYETQERVVDKVDRLNGAWDGVVNLRDFGDNLPDESAILEIKSISDYGFKSLAKAGLRAEKPEYFGQVQAYMRLRGLNYCVFIAKSKATGEKYVELVPFSMDDFVEVKRRAGILFAAIRDEQIPAPDYDPVPRKKHRTKGEVRADWHCEYCDFASECEALGRPPRPLSALDKLPTAPAKVAPQAALDI